MNTYPGGVWPVMLTPFTREGAIDEQGLRALVDWYIEQGVSGLFASCQSSEIFHMDAEERVRSVSLIMGGNEPVKVLTLRLPPVDRKPSRVRRGDPNRCR